jgi:hypothetical protein
MKKFFDSGEFGALVIASITAGLICLFIIA